MMARKIYNIWARNSRLRKEQFTAIGKRELNILIKRLESNGYKIISIHEGSEIVGY